MTTNKILTAAWVGVAIDEAAQINLQSLSELNRDLDRALTASKHENQDLRTTVTELEEKCRVLAQGAADIATQAHERLINLDTRLMQINENLSNDVQIRGRKIRELEAAASAAKNREIS